MKMRIYCTRCKQDTNHKCVKAYVKELTQDNTPGMQIDWATVTWQILECEGCEEITVREGWLTSEDFDPEIGEPIETVYYHHARGEGILSLKRFRNVPGNLERMYAETVKCYNNGIYTLCAAGLRAIIEGICLDRKIKDGPVKYRDKSGKTQTKRIGTLQGKIEGLKEKGLLSNQNSEILHEHRFLGNQVLHELDQPSEEQLKLAIEIVEHTLEDLYELRDKAEELRRKRKT